MSKALLICNGEKPGPWLKRLSKEADFVLAADGGADAALAAGLRPDAVIGDLDSVSPRARQTLKDAPFIHVKRQDNTDFEKALDWLVQQKFDAVTVAGAAGKRLDFTVGNFLCVYPYLSRIKIIFKGNGWTVYPLVESLSFSARKGARLSLLPLAPCRGVTLKGLKYRLKDVNWRLGQTGLSNEVSARQSAVCFKSGYLLMYLED